jgi:hypothetical protein
VEDGTMAKGKNAAKAPAEPASTGPPQAPAEAPARVNPVVREETQADVDRRRAAGEIA